MRRLIALFLVILLVAGVVGCEKKPEGSGEVAKKVERTAPLKYGMNAHVYEQRAMDVGCTIDYASEMSKIFGFEYYRLSTQLEAMFNVGPDDTLTFKDGYKNTVHKIIEKMSAAGVKYFVAVSDSPVQPYGYRVTCSGVIPEPDIEPEMYVRWVKLYGKAWGMIAKEFPEITHIEPMNEPDLASDNIFSKQGHRWAVDDGFIYSMTDRGQILADIQYYVYKEVRAVNSDMIVTTPGFSTHGDGHEILDYLYEAIESGAHPFKGEAADTDPDHYFDCINFHHYLNDDTIDEYFEHCDSFYKACERHNDAGKPAIMTEWGFTDRGNEETIQKNGERMTEQLKMFEEKMPYLEAALVYMLCDYHGFSVSDAEDKFGLFTSPSDPEKTSCPKPAAISFYKYINKTEDVSPLYKYCPQLKP